MSASATWTVAEADFPATGSPRDRLGFALKYAALAPTGLNWQPWEFRLTETALELFAKDDASLQSPDPDGRELLIGCGAALHHLNLALKHFGCLGRKEFFPDLDQPVLVARIHFGFSRERNVQEKLLFEAMIQRRQNPSSLGESPVSEMTLTALTHAVAGERGWLEFAQSQTSRQRVIEIIQAHEQQTITFDRSRAQPTNEAMPGSTSRWPRPLFAFGGRKTDAPITITAPPGKIPIPTATLAVVKTKTDDKHGWVAAGQTMARAILQAQALGLSWSFFNPVRRRETREALRIGIGHKGFAQTILRIGSLVADETIRFPTPSTATATFR